MRKRYSTLLPVLAVASGLFVVALIAGQLGAARHHGAPVAAGHSFVAPGMAEAPSVTGRSRPAHRNGRHLMRMPYFSFAQSLRTGS